MKLSKKDETVMIEFTAGTINDTFDFLKEGIDYVQIPAAQDEESKKWLDEVCETYYKMFGHKIEYHWEKKYKGVCYIKKVL